MKLTLVPAAQILGMFVPVLRGRIRHPRVLAFVGRKPATVEIGRVVKCTVFCALADGFDSRRSRPSSTSGTTWWAASSPTRTSTARPTTYWDRSRFPSASSNQ